MSSHIINVLDTEWTCYPDGVFPEGERAEPIEFGLTRVDCRQRKIIKRVCIPVIPAVSKVSAFCTELTGWTAHSLVKRGGVSLAEACRRISEKYGGKGRLLVVDTADETTELAAHCQSREIAYPFGNDSLNVSMLFALLTGEPANLGLAAMLQKMGLSFEGRQHCGYDDSFNIARLFLEILQRGSFKLPAA